MPSQIDFGDQGRSLSNGDESSLSSELQKMEGEGKKTRLTITIDERVAELLRDAAYYTPGTNVSRLLEEGARRVLEELIENDGEIQPRPDGARLSTGPPTG